jgi:hypothetical protein
MAQVLYEDISYKPHIQNVLFMTLKIYFRSFKAMIRRSTFFRYTQPPRMHQL